MPRYGFEHEKPERLAGIEATWDRGTRALLDSLRIGPGRQGTAFDRYSMLAHRNALLAAADAADVPMIVLLGSPQYYGRFGFRPARELGVIPPEPRWGDAFQARPLTAYTPAIAGRFRYASAFPP